MIEPVQLPSPWRDARLTVVVPTYNEAGNIPVLVERLLALPLPGLSILIADDNSPDGTGEVADKLAIEYPDRIQVVHRPGKEGLGRAYVDGISRALDGGAEYVAQMDADLSHPPEALPGMLGSLLSTRAGVVIGSRYVPGGQLDEAWPWYRRALSGWANFYVHTLLQVRIRDLTAGFKIWRADALRDIGLERVQSNGYSFQVEMHYLATKLGHTILEVPIRFQERMDGDSKMTTATKIESALMPFKLRGRHRNITRTDGRSATFPEGTTVPADTPTSPADPATSPADAPPTPADAPTSPADPATTLTDTAAPPDDAPATPTPTPDDAPPVTAGTPTVTEESATVTPLTSTVTETTTTAPRSEATTEEISDAPERPATGKKAPEKKPGTADRSTVPASRTTKRRPKVPKESAS